MPLRRIQILLWGLVAVAAVAGPLWWVGTAPPLVRSTGVAAVGGPFVLRSSKGGLFDSKTLTGKPYAIFFGFTYCPDICPTTVAELSGFLETLGASAKDFPVLFVTVDPERDTPEVLADFLTSFDPRIIGLTGTEAEIEAVVRAFAAFRKRQALDGGNYTMDHTASVYLMGADGTLVSTLDYKEAARVKLQKLKNLLAGKQSS